MVDCAVVDYGINNLHSVVRGLERAGATPRVATDPDALADADGVVLPGVGAFGDGVANVEPFREELLAVADRDQPLLGICLGMQLLCSGSEEAPDAEGLGLIPGRNVRFRDAPTVPHMGWNDLRVERDHPVVDGVDGEYVYFVHSYYPRPEDETAVVATAAHGERFPAVVADETGTVVGTQFHPEKSGDVGIGLLSNFVDHCRRA